jgi:hypothetical protein
MNLRDLKTSIESAEPELHKGVFVVAGSFERNGRRLDVALTDRFRKKCKKGRIWKNKAFLTAFKNAEYGFDEKRAMSPGGSDGIFILTRNYRPKNEMMKKIFDRYLDLPGSGAGDVAGDLGVEVEDLIPVRLVSHHLRLIGVLCRSSDDDILVLVDYDDNK